MTVNTATATASYTGNGTTAIFSVPFYFLLDTDLKVSRKTAAGATSVLTLNSNYTLSGAGNANGGSITLIPALPAGDQIFIQRNVDAVQQTAYPSNSTFPSASHEKALDRLTMLIQQLQTADAFTLKRDPLGNAYDVGGNRLINAATAVDPQDVPNLVQVQALVVAGASPALAGDNGSALVGFKQAGTGASSRTVQDKLRERVSPEDFGALGDGATDDTAAFSAALAVGAPIRLGAKTYLVDHLDLPSGATLIGDRKRGSVIKRKATATTTYVIGAGGVNGIHLENITVDGNKTANANPAHNILIGGNSYDWTLLNVTSKNAKGSGGAYGCGLAVVSTADATQNTYPEITGGEYSSNDVHGAYVSIATRFRVSNVAFVKNGTDGLSIVNFALPSQPTETHWYVTGCKMAFNGGSGMGVSGFSDELNKPTSYANTITGNSIHHNIKYGLAYQSSTAAITGNVITNNGDSDFNGGVLINAQHVTFTGNTVCDNTQYGVDAGGCSDLIISGNLIRDNVGPGGGGCGLNLGASSFTNVTGNTFYGNGGAGGGGAIFIHGYDGGGIPAFRTLAGQLHISSNHITLMNSNQYGIAIDKGDPRGISVKNNAVYGGSATRAYSYQCRFTATHGNLYYPDNVSPYPSIAGATSLVIPDDGTDIIDVTGSALTISELLTQSQSDFKNKVRAVYMSAFGSGYTSAPTVSFSGGGGTGATATAIIANGEVRAVQITNTGSGYTSAPTVSFSGGGGTGATGTVLTECPNQYGRTIRIHAASGIAVSSSNNIRLASTWTSNGNNFLTLVGLYSGNWYETARS